MEIWWLFFPTSRAPKQYYSCNPWAPDGPSGSRGIHAVPALGGPERNLIPTEEAVAVLDWSPDGNWLAVSLGKDQSADAIMAGACFTRSRTSCKPMW